MRPETRTEVEAAFKEDRLDWWIDPATPYFILHRIVKSLRIMRDDGGPEPWSVSFEGLQKSRHSSAHAAAQAARKFLK
jgi:hypothetical protein